MSLPGHFATDSEDDSARNAEHIPGEDAQMTWALSESSKLALIDEISIFKASLENNLSTEGSLLLAISELEKRGPFSVDVLKTKNIGKRICLLPSVTITVSVSRA